VDFSYQIAALS